MALGLRQLRYSSPCRCRRASRAAKDAHAVGAEPPRRRPETDLGVKLLERRPRGIALTAAGRPLRACQRRAIGARQGRRGRATHNEAATGPVCIGLPYRASMVALDVMKAVRTAGRASDCRRGAVAGTGRAVFSGTVDLALAYIRREMPASMSNCCRRKTSYLVGHPSLIGRSSSRSPSAIPTKRGY